MRDLIDYEKLAAKCKEDDQGWCSDQTKRHKAAELMIDTCYELLPVLTGHLNRMHGVDHSERYWHILLGAWLYHFCCIVYDRKCLLAYLTDEDVFKANTRIVPRDAYESIQLAANNDFNRQLFHDILFGINPNEDFTSENKGLVEKERLNLSYLKILLFNYMSGSLTTKKSVVVSLSAMPIKFQLSTLKQFKWIRPIKPFTDNYSLFNSSIDFPVRQGLMTKPSKQEFANLVNSLIPFYIPVCFVEGYKKLDKLAKRYTSKPAAILSTSEIYYRHESFKYWLAKCSESGTKVLNLQHGGTYGVTWRSGDSFIERAVSDIFYTWGWKHKCYRFDDIKIKPMPVLPNFFGNQRQAGPFKDSKRILFASDLMRTTLREFGGISNDAHNRQEYLASQLSFYEKLPVEIRKLFYLRVGELKMSKDMSTYKKTWEAEHPSILFDNRSIDFRTSLRNSKLFIVDHLSTTWLESMIIDVPTVIFINKKDYDLTEEFDHILELLHSVSILHYSYDSAAQLVASINNNVSSWWKEEHRSNIVKEVLDKIAKSSDNPVTDWSKELKKFSSTLS